MERLLVNPALPDAAILEAAADRLRAGGVIAYPTETLYGLGVDIRQSAAVAKLYRLKGRPAGKPISVAVADPAMLEEWVSVSELAQALITACWPGPLTLILPAKPSVASALLAGGSGLGVRAPGLGLARELCRRLGAPITATSANLSGGPEPRSGDQVALSLGNRLDLLLDAGTLAEGKASTVLDLCGPRPRILREGAISRETLAPYLN